MEEQIVDTNIILEENKQSFVEKYKNGLLGVGLCAFFALWCIYASLTSNPPSFDSTFITNSLIGLVISFLLFQYIFKFLPKSSPISDVNLIAVKGKKRLFKMIITIIFSFVMIIFIRHFSSSDGGGIGGALVWAAIGAPFLFILIILPFVGFLNSVYFYFKTHNKEFAFYVILFGIILVTLFEIRGLA
jgi:multisubunit Na+/H+ antiporter MnhB subunit